MMTTTTIEYGGSKSETILADMNICKFDTFLFACSIDNGHNLRQFESLKNSGLLKMNQIFLSVCANQL